MKKSRIYLLIAICLTIALGLDFDKLFTKSYAAGSDNESRLPAEAPFEVSATGTSRSADYEIVTIYGRKYIIFSSGSDIEVLEY